MADLIRLAAVLPPAVPDEPFTGNAWNGIAFTWTHPDEFSGSIQLADDAAQVTMGVKVPWDIMNAACVRLLGWPEVKTVDGVSYISRTIPLRYPGIVGAFDEPFLYAKSVSKVQGIGARGKMDDGTPRYDWAIIWISFVSQPYEYLDDSDMSYLRFVGEDDQDEPLGDLPDEATLTRYVSFAGDPFDRAVSMPRGVLKRVAETGDKAGTHPILEGCSRQEPGTDLQIVHHCRPDYPLVTILDTMGKLNSYSFAGYDAGMLVCQSPKRRVYRSSLGQILSDITFRFRFTAKVDRAGVLRDANHFLAYITRTGPPESAILDYRKFTVDGTTDGASVYGEADFADLFRPIQGD